MQVGTEYLKKMLVRYTPNSPAFAVVYQVTAAACLHFRSHDSAMSKLLVINLPLQDTAHLQWRVHHA